MRKKGGRDKGTKGQRGKAAFFLLLSLLAAASLCAHAETASCSKTVVLDAEDQFAFAQDYFESGEYDKAIIEFERFIHFFPDDDNVGSALHHSGKAHFQLGQHAEAIEAFGRHIRRNTDETGIDISPEVAGSIWLASESYQALGQTDRSLVILHRLLAETDDPALEDETYYRIGWNHVRRQEWERARNAFKAVSDEGENNDYNIKNILSGLDKADDIPLKSPGLAGTLSIIPGTGYLYLGRYRDAATAFLLNAALIGATWEAFDNGNDILGGLLGVVGAGFYSGNVYGSISSAHKFNLDRKESFIQGLRESARFGSFAGGDRIAFLIQLQY